jgi:CRISPR-associated protein Csm3
MSLRYVKMEGILMLKSGMRIGGSKEGDNNAVADVPPILRHPITREPYIPGSSLKGKIRSLLEYQYRQAQVMATGLPCGCMKKDCFICVVFGPHIQGRDQNHELGPTRLLMRDATLWRSPAGTIEAGSYEWLKQHETEEGRDSEFKQENIGDRKTGKAAGRGLRTLERIPAGTKFDFRLSLRIFGGDDEAKFKAFITEGLQLLQQDALGGAGSRGYGEIEIKLDGV